MPRTPDFFPGQREEESLVLLSGSTQPVKIGEITYVSGSGFKFYEEGVIRTLTSSSISSTDHKTLRQLIHLADGGGPFEGFSSGAVMDTGPIPFPTASIWYVSSARTQKIVEQIVSYNSSSMIISEQWKAYAVDGTTVIATVTDAITYNGVFETTRTRTIA
jgi:hypothetical protein